jgi:hypothetical protein
MSISRWIVVVPVLVGFAVTGSAVAHMLPRETVRDTVYQTCQHNGVHFNKQGHANCGLHKGWSDVPTTEAGDQPTTEPSHGGSAGHAPKHGDQADHGKGQGKGHGHHGATTRGGSSGHGGTRQRTVMATATQRRTAAATATPAGRATATRRAKR